MFEDAVVPACFEEWNNEYGRSFLPVFGIRNIDIREVRIQEELVRASEPEYSKVV